MKLLNEAFDFKKGNFTEIRQDIEHALQMVSSKYDLKITLGNINYSDDDFDIKINFRTKRDPADEFMIDYRDSYLFAYPITKDMYGKYFTGQDGKEYKLVGIKRTNRRTNKVLKVQGTDGREGICTPEFLGIQQENSELRVNFNR